MKNCICGRELEREEDKYCNFCNRLPKDSNGVPKFERCYNCNGIINGGGNGHYVPGGFGMSGFVACKGFRSDSQKPIEEWNESGTYVG